VNQREYFSRECGVLNVKVTIGVLTEYYLCVCACVYNSVLSVLDPDLYATLNSLRLTYSLF
jgi:hypothetical protein